jgi:hypothetical protein
VTAGEPVAIEGRGFVAAYDGAGGNTAASAAPFAQAVWLPLGGGPPVVGRLDVKSENEASWTPAPTAFAGPGLLFVASQGTTSEGTFVALHLARDGAACASSPGCASGHCVDGVCCATSCDGVCEACTAAKKGAGSDGVCGPVAANEDPDDECAADTFACGKTGQCSGKGTGKGDSLCAMHGAETVCRNGLCKAGFYIEPSRCDGAGQCRDGHTIDCHPFVCIAEAPSCSSRCTSDAACTADAFCDHGACVSKRPAAGACAADRECASDACVAGACAADAYECVDDHTRRRIGGGAQTECADNLRCSADLRDCMTACRTNLDCAAGFVCAAAGDRCEMPLPKAVPTSSCSSGAPGPRDAGGSAVFGAIAAAILAARRRARSVSARAARRSRSRRGAAKP